MKAGKYMNDYLYAKYSEEEWDKPIEVAEDPEYYYRELKDKYLYEHCYVILVEEENRYVLIKNIWRYDSDMKKCRNFNGVLFEVKDIEYVRIKGNEYVRVLNKDNIPKHIIIAAS